MHCTFQPFGGMTVCLFFFLLVAPLHLSVSPERNEAYLIVNQNLTLTCTAVLIASVDTSVMVVFAWTGPRGVLSNPTMTTQEPYASTVTVSRVQRSDSGTYTCSAIASPSMSPVFVVASSIATSVLNIMVVGKTL